MIRCCIFLIVFAAVATPASAADADLSPAERGYRNLTERAYLPPDFDQATFDSAWKYWPEPLRTAAEKATPDERRQMAFARYGLTPRPDDPDEAAAVRGR